MIIKLNVMVEDNPKKLCRDHLFNTSYGEEGERIELRACGKLFL